MKTIENKSMRMIRISVCVLALLCGVSAQAQRAERYPQDLLRLTTGGGVCAPLLTSQTMESKADWGAQVQLNYLHFFNQEVGVQIGVGMTREGTRTLINGYNEIKGKDMENGGIDCVYREKIDHLSEVQHFLSVQLPVAMVFYVPVTNRVSFKPAIGVAAQYVFPGMYKVRSGSVERAAYYPDYNLELPGDMPWHGLYTHDANDTYDWGQQGRINNKNWNASAFVDLGFDYQFAPRTSFYFGLYMSCMMLNTVNPQQRELLDSEGNYSGIMNTETVKAIRPAQLGLKVGFSFDVSRH